MVMNYNQLGVIMILQINYGGWDITHYLNKQSKRKHGNHKHWINLLWEKNM